jgi:hypothetical protein
MKRESFIKKWLGNKNFQYCEEHKELMREDLDSVLNQNSNGYIIDNRPKASCDGKVVEINGKKYKLTEI